MTSQGKSSQGSQRQSAGSRSRPAARRASAASARPAMPSRQAAASRTGPPARLTISSANSITALQRPSSRWLALFGFFVLAALVLIGRLVYIQAFAADELARLAESQRQSPQPVLARRGTIYDRNGLVLATSVDTVSIYAYIPQIPEGNFAGTAHYIAQVLGGEPEEWLELLRDRPDDVTNVCLVRYGDIQLEHDFLELRSELEQYALPVARLQSRLSPTGEPVWYADTPLSCINFVNEYKRVYPYGNIGAQVIGSVGDYTAEDGREVVGRGICGIELHYDAILAGRDGVIRVEVGKDGTPLPNGLREDEPKVDGEDIIISLDINLQEYVESEMSRLGELGGVSVGSALVLDGASGEIYAAASLPLYDRENVTAEQIEQGAMSLRCIVVPYEPGSTMKSVAAAGALEAGVVNTSEVFYVRSSREIDGYSIKDWYDHGDLELDLGGILANSSNIGMTLIGDRLGKQALFDYYFRAGFYQPTHVDYQGLRGVGEPLYTSNQTDPNTGRPLSVVDKPEWWSNIHAANLTFGQGLHVTSLQMASFYGALANDGVHVMPHFLISRPQSSTPLEVRETRIMSSETAATMTGLLEGVMTEGTGVPAAVPGYRIAGKTGTAQKASPGGGYSGQVVQSMVGYFADSDCDLVCMVAMDDSALVGNAVAPKVLFASIMEYIANRYRVVPDAALRTGDGSLSSSLPPAAPVVTAPRKTPAVRTGDGSLSSSPPAAPVVTAAPSAAAAQPAASAPTAAPPPPAAAPSAAPRKTPAGWCLC